MSTLQREIDQSLFEEELKKEPKKTRLELLFKTLDVYYEWDTPSAKEAYTALGTVPWYRRSKTVDELLTRLWAGPSAPHPSVASNSNPDSNPKLGILLRCLARVREGRYGEALYENR